MTTTDTVIIHVQEYNTVGEVQTGVSLHPDGTMQTVCGDFADPTISDWTLDTEIASCRLCIWVMSRREATDDKCAISDEGCGDYAPHFQDSNSVHCGCSECVQRRIDNYSCAHPICDKCTCINVALYG